jgi:hypothetical protein
MAALGDLTIDPVYFAEIIAGYASTSDLSSPAEIALIKALAHMEPLLFRLMQIETETSPLKWTASRLSPRLPATSYTNSPSSHTLTRVTGLSTSGRSSNFLHSECFRQFGPESSAMHVLLVILQKCNNMNE